MAERLPVDPSEARRELVQRIADSSTFARSRQARAFLLYVSECALRETPSAPGELEIAAALPDKGECDGRVSAAVRAQASHVRKKLQQYFAGEGVRESMIVDLALGSYVPLFRARDAGDMEPPATHPLVRGAPWLALACGFLLAAVWLLTRPSADPRPVSPPRPSALRLWRQMFDNGRPTTVLLADATLTQLQDLLGESIGLDDYERERLNARVQGRLLTREARLLADREVDRRHTTMADVGLAGRVLLLHASLGLSADVILARDGTMEVFRNHNVILSGPRRANPWIELFEPRLNFASHFDDHTKASSFENRAPLPGEDAAYAVRWGVRGYCRVAYLPGRDGHGTALLISGTDLTSTEAGADFITGERGVHELITRLGARSAGPMPFFEVLLRSTLIVNRTSSPELIAHRLVSPAPER